MQDVGPLAPDQRRKLQQPEQVVDGMQVAPHVAERDVAHAGGRRRVAQRPGAVGRDDDVEPAGERREQAGDVRLRPSGLGERDEQQDPRPADHLAVQLYSGPMRVGEPVACRAAGVVAVVPFARSARTDGGYAPGAWHLALEDPAAELLDRLYERGVPRPIVRRPVDCLPVQGLGVACRWEARG